MSDSQTSTEAEIGNQAEYKNRATMSEKALDQVEDSIRPFIEAQNEAMQGIRAAMKELNELIKPVMREVLPELREFSKQFKNFVQENVPQELNQQIALNSSHTVKPTVTSFEPGVERVNAIYRGQDNENTHRFEQSERFVEVASDQFEPQVLEQIKGQTDRMVSLDMNGQGIASSVVLGEMLPKIPVKEEVIEAEPTKKNETVINESASKTTEETKDEKPLTKKQVTAALQEKYGSDLSIAKGTKDISGECIGHENLGGKSYLIVKTKEGLQAVHIEKKEMQARLDSAVNHFIRIVLSNNKANKMSIGQVLPSAEKQQTKAQAEHATTKEVKQNGEQTDHEKKLDKAVDNLNKELNKEAGFKERMQDAAEIINMSKDLSGGSQPGQVPNTVNTSSISVAKATKDAGITAVKSVGSGIKKATSAAGEVVEKSVKKIKNNHPDSAKKKEGFPDSFKELVTLRSFLKGSIRDYSLAQKGKDNSLVDDARYNIRTTLDGVLSHIEKITPEVKKMKPESKQRYAEIFKKVQKDATNITKLANKYDDGFLRAHVEKIKLAFERVIRSITSSLGVQIGNQQQPKDH